MTFSEKSLSLALSEFAARLRQARLQANLTQRALAERTGVSLKTIGNAEDSGQISLETMVRLLEGLGRLSELDALLSDDGPSPLDLARRRGKLRQRASSAAKTAKDDDEWQW